jgi:hypothetical protein
MNLKPIIALAASLAAVAETEAHGGLMIPPCRNNHGNVNVFNFTARAGEKWMSGGSCAGDMCLWFNDGCFIGCPNCSSTVSVLPGASGEVPDRFIKPNCEAPALMEPTLPEEYRTWNIGNPSSYGDWTRYHPWRAPGHAPVSDPCGRAGANTAESGGGETPIGAKQFDRGSLLPKLPAPNSSTTWHRGQPAEVGWMVGSNHGGGYLYSLCPANETLTEACFRRTTLTFVGDFHVIRRLDNSSLPEPSYTIPAMQVREGTFPPGSLWRRNPIPACNCDGGKSCGVNKTTPSQPAYPDYYRAYADEAQPQPTGNSQPCATGTHFPVPCPKCYGQSQFGANQPRNMWAIVDEVQVPNVTGDFVLRWRWDTEQNPQIWTHCADVTIV